MVYTGTEMIYRVQFSAGFSPKTAFLFGNNKRRSLYRGERRKTILFTFMPHREEEKGRREAERREKQGFVV